jgi:hypothetical protein
MKLSYTSKAAFEISLLKAKRNVKRFKRTYKTNKLRSIIRDIKIWII